jgi:hypothetical protein
MALLKREAKKRCISVNRLILKMIEQGLGLVSVYHDLDHLAGSWSLSEEKDFKEHTRYFEETTS